MKIKQLFDELKKQTENKEDVFADSGIINWSEKMKYGFFPLGLGILTDNITLDSKAEEVEIVEGGVMVLGNDFGTISYVNDYTRSLDRKIGEKDSKTIINFLDNVDLDKGKTFFTNFYLGVRLMDGPYEGTTMTKRMFNGKTNKLKDDYKELCYNFFMTQLELLKPSIVICLGHDVKNALIEKSDITKWKKSDSLKKIYAEKRHTLSIKKLGNRTFVIIPHPCDLRNFKKEHIEKLAEELFNN